MTSLRIKQLSAVLVISQLLWACSDDTEKTSNRSVVDPTPADSLAASELIPDSQALLNDGLVLRAIEDTYVRAGKFATKNLGKAKKLEVKNEGPKHTNTRESLLKFNVSGLSGYVEKATLKIHLDKVEGKTQHKIYSMSDAWKHYEANWNNSRSLKVIALQSSMNFSESDSNGWVEYDVTQSIRSEVATAKVAATFKIVSSDGSYTYYGSSESKNPPVLMVKTGTKPTSEIVDLAPPQLPPIAPTQPTPPTDPQVGIDGTPFGLNLQNPPGQNFDLSSWKITFPDASEKQESWMGTGSAAGIFFTDPVTGGMVFRSTNLAGSTSGSKYSRSELREMLRAGVTSISTSGIGKNNWVLSSTSVDNKNKAGGVDGTLTATLRVDHVSTTGTAAKVGRVIVGQIHASENEPCRLYYRKLPSNTRGSIYFAYEPNQGAERFIEMIGSKNDGAKDPEDGIALGEIFGYEISTAGERLTVTISRPGKPNVAREVDLSQGGFSNDWFYFKAGVYNQNNSGTADDYAQATFFKLSHTHD